MVRPAFAGDLTEAPAIDVIDKDRVMLNTKTKERETFFEIMRFPS
jgi:hypothetical protein